MCCEKCIHNSVCDHTSRMIYATMLDDGICTDFQDKSFVINLPVIVGDTVYYIKGGRVNSGEVKCLRPIIHCDMIEYLLDVEISYPDFLCIAGYTTQTMSFNPNKDFPVAYTNYPDAYKELQKQLYNTSAEEKKEVVDHDG